MAFNDNILDSEAMRDDTHYQPNVADYTVTGMTRFGHHVIDSIVMIVVILVIMYALDVIGIISFGGQLENINILTYLLYIFYYPIMEFSLGKTVGKMLTKSTVVREDGGRITLGQAFGRSLCRLIPFDAFSFLGSTAVGWHDSISKTRVVKDVFLEHNSEYDRYGF